MALCGLSFFARAGIDARTWWRTTRPHATPGSSRQAVPGGGDLWVAEEHSVMGGAPQARFVL